MSSPSFHLISLLHCPSTLPPGGPSPANSNPSLPSLNHQLPKQPNNHLPLPLLKFHPPPSSTLPLIPITHTLYEPSNLTLSFSYDPLTACFLASTSILQPPPNPPTHPKLHQTHHPHYPPPQKTPFLHQPLSSDKISPLIIQLV